MDVEFSGEIWEWRGPAPYHFVSVPDQESLDLRDVSAAVTYGWGMLPVEVRVGDTAWKTSLWPKDGRYVLPLKDFVRKAEGLAAGDTVTVRLTAAASPAKPKTKATRPAPTTGQRPQGEQGEPAAGGSRRKPPVTDDQLTIVPANEATWEDLQAVFGTSGDPARCWCQRYRMLRRESWTSVGADGLADRLRDQTACDDPRADTTTGLVAYLDGEPVGWCAVAPRADHPRLLRDCRVPWVDRAEAKQDGTIWAVTCFVTRRGHRRRGISHALARAAVDFARERGARAIEGYPNLATPDHVGTLRTFAAAGFVEVSRPTKQRAVMRIDY